LHGIGILFRIALKELANGIEAMGATEQPDLAGMNRLVQRAEQQGS
jgi:hypothetical protein